MAQKKKDKRQQKINQRRAEKTRERKHKNHSRPNTAKSAAPLQPMAPLMEYVRKHSATPEEMNSNMEFLIEDSGQLVQEPEFTELLIDPLTALQIMAEMEQNSGREIDEDDEMTTEDIVLFNQSLSKLLTPQVQTAILQQLKALAERQEASHNLAKAAHINLLYSLLTTIRTREVWTLIEFIRTLIEKSIGAGYDLIENVEELQKNPVDKAEQIEQLTELINRHPGLESFIENQIDEVYTDGLQALYKGELELDIFTPAELEISIQVWQQTIGSSIDLQHADPNKLQNSFVTYMERLEPQLTALATPTRLSEMQVYIEQFLAKSPELVQWQPFLLMIRDDLAEGEGYEHFLTHAMVGQTGRMILQAKS